MSEGVVTILISIGMVLTILLAQSVHRCDSPDGVGASSYLGQPRVFICDKPMDHFDKDRCTHDVPVHNVHRGDDHQ